MLFNSFEFAVFFIIVLVGAFILQEINLYRKLFLIVASFIFYMHWKVDYGWLLAGSILFNFYIAKLIGEASVQKRRKILIVFAVFGNLLLLSVYKYTNFFIGNINFFFNLAHLKNIKAVDIVLPIGISFFTFQAISYIVDVYKNKIKPASLTDTALYISFFPHLIAGPIIRAIQIIPQFAETKAIRHDNLITGTHRIFWGLIKKMVIADNLAVFVNQAFAGHSEYNWLTLLLGVYAFAFQIYCDFSGYSDIAIGCFRILGYNILENFNLPYMAKDFSDFWKRWHISLSSWLRDYLYIPLGGNRLGNNRTLINLMITMFLGGLWHGARWTFVIWGLLHGIYLVIQKLLEGRIKLPDNPLMTSIRMFVTFQLVCLAWIFFRAESFSSAMSILSSILTLKEGVQFIPADALILLALSFGFHFAKYRMPLYEKFLSMPYYIRYFAYSVGFFLLFFNKASLSSQFIYFQF